MSRVLKFRAWDGERMRTDFFQLCVYDDGCELWLYDESQDWPVMQFTGLTDSEGVEIYEDDLLLLKEVTPRGDGSYDDLLAYVFWSKSDAAFFAAGVDDSYRNFLMAAVENDCEVAGNRWENPELQEGDR